MNQTDKKIIVACHGASITRGLGSFNWINELKKRPQNARYELLNFGVGGDPASNGLERLPHVLAARPDKVIVAFGWNDIILAVFPETQRLLGRAKKLPEKPTIDSFRINLEAIVGALKGAGIKDIALMSLSQMGEDPDSTEPVQAELNKRFAEYSAVVKRIADAEGIYYIPFYEALHDALMRTKHHKPFKAFHFRNFYWDAAREFVFGRKLDTVAFANGWDFHVDGLHLNTRGGMILTELVQKYLDETGAVSSPEA